MACQTDAVVVRAGGTDVRQYLEDVTSQSLVDLGVGEVRSALVLDAAGEPVAVFDVIGDDQDVLLLVAPDEDTGRYALETMASRTFLLDVTFALTDLAVVAFRGVPPPAGGDVVASIPRPHGVDLVTDDPEAARAGAPPPPADPARLLADWDIAHGVPRWGHEIAPPNLPEEIGLLPTHVHLKKGCYPGQEAVARMWNLGRPRRRLARVELEGSFEEGHESGSGRDRVTVTGVVSGDPTVGMAFVRRDAAPGDVLAVNGGTVSVTALVGEGLEVPGHDPATTRRRDTR